MYIYIYICTYIQRETERVRVILFKHLYHHLLNVVLQKFQSERKFISEKNTFSKSSCKN